MRTYKITSGLLAATIALTALTGCGDTAESSASSAVSAAPTTEVTESVVTEETVSAEETSTLELAASEGTNTFAYSDTTKEAPVSTTISGQVTAVDGTEITLSIGGMGGGMGGDMGGGMGGGQDGSTPPEKPEDSADQSGTNPAEATDTTAETTDTTAENTDATAETTDTAAAAETTDGDTPPEKPEDSGDQSGTNPAEADGAQGGGEAPADMGSAQEGTMPEATEAETATLTLEDESVLTQEGEDGTETAATLSDITEGVTLEITFDDQGEITAIVISQSGGEMMGGGMGGGSEAPSSYTSVNEYSEDTTVSGETISSTGTDENAVLVSGGEVTLDDVTIDRTSGDSTGGDNSSFYGVGAAVLGTSGTTYVTDSTITTDAAGGAGVFSYGDNTTYVSNTTIETQQDTSGGVHVAGGGTLYAWQLAVKTAGESAAAIRSDRGGGTMVIDGGSYESSGVGSPALYCTADIAVNDATLTATGSEAICMEGLNTIHLFDCDISGAMQDLDQNDTTWNIIVYQSMSGDAEVGNSTLQIVGGSLTAENGGMIYTTNTESNILLSDVDITYAEDSEFFLQCTGNNNQRGWGTTGANGANCTFTADNQDMEGKVIWDSISTLDFYMTNGSTLTGSFVDDETWAGDGGDGDCSVYISEDSTWTVTGDSTVTNLYNAGTIVDEDGNTVSIVGADGTVYVSGTSGYTITVTSYETTADLSGAAETDSWENHAVDMPENLA